MTSSIISLKNVAYQYPASDTPALRDFSLEVDEGEFLLVTGVSGAGKSTLLRLLNGLVPHFYGGTVSGRISVAGRDPVAVGPGDMSDSVGLVFQDPEAQFVAEVVEDEMAFAMENAGLPLATMRKRVEESLHALGIDHLRGRRVNTLSGGERQRVAIAAVLTLQPKIVVLDEPTSQLDPQSAEEVLDSLVKLNKDLGLTIVLSEHRLERVVQHADRILYLGSGGTTIIGAPRDVLAAIPLAPPLAQVGKLLGWSPLPLTIKEARRFVQGSSIGEELATPVFESNPVKADATFRLCDVWFGYGGQDVLHGLSIDIRAGEITALMGRNGAGKTTILKLMTGLLKPSRGSVTTLGLDMRHSSLEAISKVVGYVPQQPDLLLFADSVQAEVNFTRKTHGLPPDGAELLAGLGLTRYSASDPRDLSVGERQRVALAAVLSGEPQALILDEPTRGLDYLQKDALVAILRRLRDEGRTVVLATHDVELAAHLADRVILLGDGEIITDGPAREVMTGSLVFSSQVSKLFRNPALVTLEDVAAQVAGNR
ncbi:MAG: energy-coupling factor transporter ATPase [Chloroflexota bacterium]